MIPYRPKNARLIPLHNFLVRAAETERGLPLVKVSTLQTFWPETSRDKHVDYTPDKTRVTYCGPTNDQIDGHGKALDLVAKCLTSEVDRHVVWAVVHSAAHRHRGPTWSVVVRDLKQRKGKYPRSVHTLKRHYEEALLTMLAKRWNK